MAFTLWIPRYSRAWDELPRARVPIGWVNEWRRASVRVAVRNASSMVLLQRVYATAAGAESLQAFAWPVGRRLTVVPQPYNPQGL